MGLVGLIKFSSSNFSMPLTPAVLPTIKMSPAIWFIESKIPRTLQYGDASCSCWKTGCVVKWLFRNFDRWF
ncbi:BPK_collapsed_G0003770.mRNA.1.CDS.1 [Saccharomyces cerevisiae]|nr:BPK_collapsed_G0003770.mRNA.1.CDS.1 [Saccharomyces cerevisiae]